MIFVSGLTFGPRALCFRDRKSKPQNDQKKSGARMVFSSPLFLFLFFPVYFLCYTLSPKALKNWVALGASVLFYAWGAPTFIFYLAAFCLLDYVLARLIDHFRGKT